MHASDACTRAVGAVESVGADTAVDYDVGRLEDIGRPQIEFPLELSCGPLDCSDVPGPLWRPHPRGLCSWLSSPLAELVEAHDLARPDVVAAITSPSATTLDAHVLPAETLSSAAPFPLVLPHPASTAASSSSMRPSIIVASSTRLPAAAAPAMASTPSTCPPVAQPVGASSQQALKVYSCRFPRCSDRATPPAAAAQALPSTPPSPASEFVQDLSKVPGGILPIPKVDKRRRKKLEPPSRQPRCSLRIAGLPVPSPDECPPHLLKQVMRALDLNIEEERERISQQALDEYAQCFKQPMPASHTMALATLFGWSLPDAACADDLECIA